MTYGGVGPPEEEEAGSSDKTPTAGTPELDAVGSESAVPSNGGAVGSDGVGNGTFDAELECPVCMKLLFKPVSTECGHTFCRVCLAESLQHRPLCPLCRHPLAWNGFSMIGGSNSPGGGGVSFMSSPQIHDNKIVQRLIERHYPTQSATRALEIRESLQQADEYMHHRRIQQANQTLQEENTNGHNQPETDTEQFSSTSDCHIPLILQKAKFALPLPGEPVELYFEGLTYTTFLADVLSQGRTCIALGTDADSAVSETADNDEGVGSSPSDSVNSSTMNKLFIGVLVKIHRCQKIVFPAPARTTASISSGETGGCDDNDGGLASEAPYYHQVATTLVSLGRHFAPFRSPTVIPEENTAATADHPSARWVPRRLFDQRRRFGGNKRELYRPEVIAAAPLEAQASYIISGEALFRLQLDSTAVQSSSSSLSMVNVAPLFDAPLLTSDTSAAENDLVAHAQTVELASCVREKLLRLLQHVGSAGRIIYNRRYGSLAVVPLRPTSSQLEDLSFQFWRPVEMSSGLRCDLLACSSTSSRLRKLAVLLEQGGSTVGLNLGLPSGNGDKDLFSFLMVKNTRTSLVLGLILVAILIVGAVGNRWKPQQHNYRITAAAKFINSAAAAGGFELNRFHTYSTGSGIGSLFGL